MDKIKGLDPVNREILDEYVRQARLRNLQDSSIGNKLIRVYVMLRILKFKDARTLTPRDVEDFILERRDTCSPETVHRDIVEIRQFIKFLFPGREKEYFPMKFQKPKHRLPVEELITKSDVLAMVKACNTPRDRALLMLIWDSGARIDELLSREIWHVTFDRLGAVLIVDGKTGERRLRLTSSVPDLQAWLNVHPMRDQPRRDSRGKEIEAPLFTTYTRYGTGKKRLDVRTVQNRLKRLAVIAGVQKRVHPHGIRHARLTDLANRGLTEHDLKIVAGWTPGSNMAGVYVHMSGADVEKKILELEGMQDKEEQAPPDPLAPRVCPRCKALNPPDCRYCGKCSLILDEQTAIEVMQAEAQARQEPQYEEVMQDLRMLQAKVDMLKHTPHS